MTEKGKYLYCIIKEKKPKKFGIKGIEGKDIYSICTGPLSVVVSDSEIKEYIITRENLLAHQKVIEEVFKKYDVLPISFGTVAENWQALKEKILNPKAKELLEGLERIRGRMELGLKAFWLDTNSVFQEIAKSQTIQSFKKSKNLGYQEKILVGQLVAKLLEEKREREKEEILNPLKRITDDFKENQILGDDMILNTAFLVKKNKEKEFDEEVNLLGEKYGQRIKFKYIGPLPPFNFIKFSL